MVFGSSKLTVSRNLHILPVTFTQETCTANIYDVHLIQIKTGATTKAISLGGMGSVEERHRTVAQQSKRLSNFDQRSGSFPLLFLAY